MDINEDINNSYKQTAVYVISALQQLIDDGQYLYSIPSSMQLEKVLLMLTTNLPFDDPGLFEKIIVEDKQCRYLHEAFNMWLNHQIVFVFSTTTNKSIRRHIYEAQLKILSAAYLKQRWLFDKMLIKYVQLTRALADFPASTAELENVKIFEDNNDLSNVSTDCKWNVITLVQAEVRHTLLESNLKLLIIMLTIMCGDNQQLESACTECVLHAFDKGLLPVKIMCVQYFKKLFDRNTVRANAKLVPVLQLVLHQTIIISTYMDAWLRQAIVQASDVQSFYRSAENLFKTRQLAEYFSSPTDRRTLLIDCLDFLSKGQCSFGSESAENFVKSVSRFTVDTLQLSSSGEHIQQVLPVFNRQFGLTPYKLRLLEYCVLNGLLKQCDRQVVEIVTELLSSMFTDAMHSNTEKVFLGHLRLIKCFIKTLQYAEHEFEIWHQNLHLAGTQQDACTICTSANIDLQKTRTIEMFGFNVTLRTNTSNMTTLFHKILDKFPVLLDSACISTHESVHEIAEIALALFGSTYCCSTTHGDALQPQLLHIGLSTFLHSSVQNSSVQSAKIAAVLLTPCVNGDLETFPSSFVQCFLGTYLTDHNGALKSNLLTMLDTIEPRLLQPNILYSMYLHCAMQNVCSIEMICDKLLQFDLTVNETNLNASDMLKIVLCLSSNMCYILRKRTSTGIAYQAVCTICDRDTADNIHNNHQQRNANQLPGVIMTNTFTNATRICTNKIIEKFSKLFHSNNKEVRMNMVNCLPSIANHFSADLAKLAARNDWPKLCNDKSLEIRSRFTNILHELLASKQTEETRKAIAKTCLDNLRVALVDAVSVEQQPVQASVVMMVLKFGTHNSINEEDLLRCFKMQLIFMMRIESVVAKNAMLAVNEMCARFGTHPLQLFHWHNVAIFSLLIDGAVVNFLEHGIELNKTLANISELLERADFQRSFIVEYAHPIVSMLLPWRIKIPKCQKLLDEVCFLLKTDLKETLCKSVPYAYPYLFLNESSAINKKCIDFIVEKSGKTLEEHLKADCRLSEILVWYNRNPEFVMQTLRLIIGGEGSGASLTDAAIADYIATRFLGVLTHFSMYIPTDLERKQQLEMLSSLGKLMRFLGFKHVTPFRFKILTVLRTALGIDRLELREVCAEVWKIFIYTVDVHSMGPLLSTIVVSLEPLMLTHADLVNKLLAYLIISNGSLLSIYITDLFFIEDTNCSSEIKEVVAQHLHTQRGSDSFTARFQLLSKQINHENMDIRVRALRYLTKLFRDNRQPLNALIVGQQQIDPIFVELLNTLMKASKHIDEQLQLAAGECLGVIGAIEPSLLSPNYALQKKFPFSIHTDAFAIMALPELCRAYQAQTNTQRVDVFSLAMQEILLARDVDPANNKKMAVWNAIPERMRPLMETLLKSSYTTISNRQSPNVHPIFGSSLCKSSEVWAFEWARKMIDCVEDEDTKHLLKSFQPSIRHDNNILAMFLPYILVHTLQSSSESNAEQIVEELRCVFAAVTSRPLTGNTEIDIKCAKLAFNQLDFVDCWMRQCESNGIYKIDANYKRIEAFQSKFDKHGLAKVNFQCGEYARALMYLEMYIDVEPSQRLQPNLSLLTQILAELMDSDAVQGALSAKHANRTLNEQVLLNNATGRLQDSTVCFEKMIQIGDVSEQNVVDMIQCYIGLDQPETALLVSESLMQKMYEQHTMHSALVTGRAECLWQLSRFEELDAGLLDNGSALRNSSDWGIRCGQTLLAFRRGNVDELANEVIRCRLSVLQQLRAASGDEQISYNKLYPLVMKLHLISEMEMAQSAVQRLVAVVPTSRTENRKILQSLFDEWDARLELLQPTARTLVQVMCLRRILLNETKEIIRKRRTFADANDGIGSCVDQHINDYIGKSLIRSTELARNAEMYQQAQLFTFNAESYAPPSLFIEKAKLMWKKGDQAASLQMLERGTGQLQLSMASSSTSNLLDADEGRKIIAEAKYLVAVYNAEAMNTNAQLNIKLFQAALKALPESEKCLVHYSQYLEKVFAALTPDEQLEPRGIDYQQDMMTCYGKSLMYGCNYVHQSMPRVLSIWLDFTARRKINETHKKMAQNLNRITERLCEQLPAFIFFTAFSQLLSRICHRCPEVYAVLKKIIIKLILQFPHQSLWMMMNVYKSSYTSRVRRCSEIFADKRLGAPPLQKLINDFNLLVDRMIELTNAPVNVGETSVLKLCRGLPRLLQSAEFSSILLPIRKHMLPVLPAVASRDQPAHTFNAFPNAMVSISGVRDAVLVLQSLQKPKRVTLIGSDGCDYMMLMKPKDDLRKDYRLMEFNAIVNQHLHQSPEARQRRLYIRTYAVMPLNEECGIMEWVSNLQSFRPICMEIYKRKKVNIVSNKEVKELNSSKMSPTQKRELLEKRLIPRFPDVFAEWFRDRFTTPHNWYLARSSYVRTTAVMSIVGYILGLGDRHGENILFDASNGDTVHVDLNCLFNRGELLEVPEVVPFRLTHNMVHAMGPLGIEGPYRKCSEITLKVLQDQMATLMSVLQPFVYDPMVTWNRVPTSDGRTERTDNEAMANIKRIEERLKGFVKMNDGKISNIALSTEGVVSQCISQAVDLDKLALMYIGWAPYL